MIAAAVCDESKKVSTVLDSVHDKLRRCLFLSCELTKLVFASESIRNRRCDCCCCVPMFALSKLFVAHLKCQCSDQTHKMQLHSPACAHFQSGTSKHDSLADETTFLISL